jgi:hypothetical protein
VTFEGVAGESVLGDEHLTERGQHFRALAPGTSAPIGTLPAEDAVVKPSSTSTSRSR